MTAIYKREVKAYLHSMTGWLFMAAFLFLTGLYFMAVNLLSGYPDISYTLASVAFLFIIAIPVLSMRIMAEDRKQKTDQLILTAPVTVGRIVTGKYLAMLTVFAVPVAVTALFPLILSRFGKVPFGTSYTSLLGYFLYGAVCLAIGLFLSSLTESQVIAAVLSVAALFVGYMMSSICNLISQSGNLLTQVLNVFDLNGRFQKLLGGTMDLTAVLYFLTVIFVFLFLTSQAIQKRRYSISRKGLKPGAYSTGLVAVVLALAVVLNLAAGKLPAKFTQFDVTDQKLYTLTEQTVELLKGLEQDVTIYVLASEEEMNEVVAKTLQNYEANSSRVKVVYKDPVKYPDFYKNYTDDASGLTVQSLIVVSGDVHKIVNYNTMFETEIDYTTYSSNVTGYDGEGQITSAISYVTEEERPVIYLVEGHQETSLDSSFRASLEKQNVEVESLNLMKVDSVPADAQALLILSPAQDYSADDAAKVKAYLNGGGRVLAQTGYLEDYEASMPNFSGILQEFGLSIEKGLVVEPDRSYYYGDPFYLLPEIQSDELTKGVYDSGRPVFMPYAQGIVMEKTEGVTVDEVLTSSASSYSRTGLDQVDAALEKQETDPQGPFVLAADAVKELEDGGEARLLLFTSVNLFTDSANQMTANANLELFGNACGQLVDEEYSSSVPVKEYEAQYITINAFTAMSLGLLFTVVLPLVCLILGFVIWFGRRKR